MMDKMGMDDEGEGDMDMDMDMDGDSDDEDLEDRVDDLETALDDLKAEFDKMMGDDEGGDEEGDMDMDMDMGDEGEAEDESVALESKDDEEVDEDPMEELASGSFFTEPDFKSSSSIFSNCSFNRLSFSSSPFSRPLKFLI